MSNATLIIAFSGLIAFVPNEARRPDFITAYLVNMSGHEPKLRVPLTVLPGDGDEMKVQNCVNAGCARDVDDNNYCACSLVDSNVTFTPSPERHRGYIRSAPFDDLPSNDNALHLSWLTRLANVGGTNVSLEKLDKETSSSVIFGWNSASACALDELVSDETGEKRVVYTFDFLPPVQGRDAHVQSVAELVVFRGGLSSRRLTIRMVSRAGDSARELRIRCESGVCPVAISNRAEYEDCCSCEKCQKGEHFDRYYDLVSNAPANRPLPYRRCKQGQQVTIDAAPLDLCPDLKRIGPRQKRADWELLLADELRDIRAVSNRIICPMAVLDP